MNFNDDLDQDNDLQINILPMIDVLFAVLIFFVISSLIINRNRMVSVDRPKSSMNTVMDQKAVIISMNREGELFINNKKTDPSSLAVDLKILQQSSGTTKLLIDADQAIQYGDVFNLIEKARSAEFTSIGLVTNRQAIKSD